MGMVVMMAMMTMIMVMAGCDSGDGGNVDDGDDGDNHHPDPVPSIIDRCGQIGTFDIGPLCFEVIHLGPT